MPEAELFQIGEVAKRVTLSLRTVRYYEEVGLVLPATRTTGNFRLYDNDAIERLLIIKQMKPLEFALEEMREVLELRALVLSNPGDEELTAARDRLGMYAAVANQRCESLREQLSVAEAFSATLAEEVARAERLGHRG
jgi:MerR family copper efflux transcriptional regulator